MPVRFLHFFALLAALVLLSGCSDMVTVTRVPVEITEPIDPLPSKILAADGSLIAELRSTFNEPVEYEDLPELLKAAVIAAEDRKFYEHDGIDINGIGRAFLVNLKHGEIAQGGSTITQQLVKNRYLKDWQQTLERKAKEANFALTLEKHRTKNEILTEYLNSAYFGAGAYGIQAGATTYFGKKLNELSLAEIALLVALLRSPEGLNPVEYPHQALLARARVLNSMYTTDKITVAQMDEANLEPIAVQSQSRQVATYNEPRFVEAVKRELGKSAFNFADANTIHSLLYTGGYTIQTTLDPTMQAAARKASRAFLKDSQPEAAVVMIEPTSGAIRASIGGRDFEANKFDLAMQGRRQPGSTFKVFGLVSALEAGWPLDYEFEAGPGEYDPGNGEKIWTYASGQSPGLMTLEEGMVRSSNGVYARLGLAVGPAAIAAKAKAMGVRSPISTNPSMVLGGLETGVSPVEMAASFGTIADHGQYHEPFLIQYVADSEGQTIWTHTDNPKQVISEETTDQVTATLVKVVTDGTGKRARLAGRQVAGKTGTANDNTDAWFVGYTPQLVCAVWTGYPQGNIPMRVPGIGLIQGGTVPSKIFALAMNGALEGKPSLPLLQNDNLVEATPTPTPTPTPVATDALGRPMTAEEVQRAKEIQDRITQVEQHSQDLRSTHAPNHLLPTDEPEQAAPTTMPAPTPQPTR